jgi:hypothetical protein
MKISRLSELYFIACSRIHETIDELYEALHDESGVPISERETVTEAISELKTALYYELDLIKSATDEHASEQ